ncbi:hypothetical protein NDU88_000131 [Pleurodeles waltl]|uniref:Uncharacterized protein n=1 Tax=Pleurodeles waltl TaxID=8319 RepID=A0AAV7S7B4_PLEWA|nr:hypothetical protein NDU88_000131 [Pleurodeles waltl]
MGAEREVTREDLPLGSASRQQRSVGVRSNREDSPSEPTSRQQRIIGTLVEADQELKKLSGLGQPVGATQPGCNHNYKQGGSTQGAAKAEVGSQGQPIGATQPGRNHKGKQAQEQHIRAGSQGQPTGRRNLAATTSTDSTGDSPGGDVARVEQQNSNRGQPSQGDTTLTMAIQGPAATQLNMESHSNNQELDIEEIIKAARESLETHSKDWILKQIREDGASEVPTQEEHTGDKPSVAARDEEEPPRESKKRQRNASRVAKKEDK